MSSLDGPSTPGSRGLLATPPGTKVPWQKNPWVWGILFCLLFPPCIRPFTRTIVEAPVPTTAPVSVDLTRDGGGPLNDDVLSGAVHIGFFVQDEGTACPDSIEAMRPLVERLDEQAYAGRGLFARDAGFGEDIRVLLAVLPSEEAALDLARLRIRCGLESDRWVVAGGPGSSVLRFAASLEGKSGQTTFLTHKRTVTIDSERRARGMYGMDELGLDELYHRSRHVLRDERRIARDGARGL